jgi:hypothetical protein
MSKVTNQDSKIYIYREREGGREGEGEILKFSA